MLKVQNIVKIRGVKGYFAGPFPQSGARAPRPPGYGPDLTPLYSL